MLTDFCEERKELHQRHGFTPTDRIHVPARNLENRSFARLRNDGAWREYLGLAHETRWTAAIDRPSRCIRRMMHRCRPSLVSQQQESDWNERSNQPLRVDGRDFDRLELVRIAG